VELARAGYIWKPWNLTNEDESMTITRHKTEFVPFRSQISRSGFAVFMRQSIIVLIFSVLFLGKASADFYDGLRAFDAGDYLGAAKEWLIAGSQGDVTSQFRLAQLYERGLGVPQDFVQAHRWYNIATSQGHADARSARDALGARLTAEQLAEAQRLATQTGALPQVELKQPAIPSVEQEAVDAPPDISRLNGRWSASGSSNKRKCGSARVKLGIHDGAVEGRLRLIVSLWQDGAAGSYPFSGTIDQAGNVQAKGHGGLSITGVISDEISTLRGIWKLHSAGCRGTYSGRKEF
jgi:hypothetical protein